MYGDDFAPYVLRRHARRKPGQRAVLLFGKDLVQGVETGFGAEMPDQGKQVRVDAQLDQVLAGNPFEQSFGACR
ncbi:hypothetical protein AB0G79_32495 [Streptomyces sp. NPDC020807]|uniref:hypothetical protein n=1 Tax=Streptomyces sp. NPDC020807 TaxID=3155119 RepID=UPI0033D37B00